MQREDPNAIPMKPNGPALPTVSGILSSLNIDNPDNNSSLSTTPSTPIPTTPAPSTPAPSTPLQTPSTTPTATTPIALPLTTPPTPCNMIASAAGSPGSVDTRLATSTMGSSSPPLTSNLASACLTSNTLTSTSVTSPIFSVSTTSNGSITNTGATVATGSTVLPSILQLLFILSSNNNSSSSSDTIGHNIRTSCKTN
ncbi:hypothetical protein E2C01_007726 [Portunus trituberculatus]|uniref:Uncharacterized protein n=1 Tax=Portunus trituberculatus TaxID=210409 RepID=A0A5B7D355_PORTR|nr:hypothetical protein [Portunus trituberculatus]